MPILTSDKLHALSHVVCAASGSAEREAALVADLAGLFGGALVAWAKLDLSPAFFLQRIQENVGAQQFWVGISKAPVFAIVIAAIGVRQCMAVGGDVESLGERVTSAVVQAIFAIIVIDAIFAMVYLELNL